MESLSSLRPSPWYVADERCTLEGDFGEIALAVLCCFRVLRFREGRGSSLSFSRGQAIGLDGFPVYCGTVVLLWVLLQVPLTLREA